MPQRLRSIGDSLLSCPKLNYRLFCPYVSLVNKIRLGEFMYIFKFNSLSRSQGEKKT